MVSYLRQRDIIANVELKKLVDDLKEPRISYATIFGGSVHPGPITSSIVRICGRMRREE